MMPSCSLTLLCTISCIIIATKSQTTKKYNTSPKIAIPKAASAENVLAESSDDYDKTKNPFYGDSDSDDNYDKAKNPFHDEDDANSEKYFAVVRNAVSIYEKKILAQSAATTPFPSRSRKGSLFPKAASVGQLATADDEASVVDPRILKPIFKLEKKIRKPAPQPPATAPKQRTTLEDTASEQAASAAMVPAAHSTDPQPGSSFETRIRALPPPASSSQRKGSLVLEQAATGNVAPVPPPRRRSIQRSMQSLKMEDVATPPRPPKTFDVLDVKLIWKRKWPKFFGAGKGKFMQAQIHAYTENNSTSKLYILRGLSDKPGCPTEVLHLEGPAVVRPDPYSSIREEIYRSISGNKNPKVYADLPGGGYILIKKFTSSYVMDPRTGERFSSTKLKKTRSTSCQNL